MSESDLMSCAEASDLEATAEEEEELVSGSENESGAQDSRKLLSTCMPVPILLQVIILCRVTGTCYVHFTNGCTAKDCSSATGGVAAMVVHLGIQFLQMALAGHAIAEPYKEGTFDVC